MNTRITAALRPLTLALSLGFLTAPFAAAQDLYVGGMNTFFSKGDAAGGNFVTLGACGGQIQSMTEDYQDLYIGDVGGRVYKHFGRPGQPFEGFTTYVFDSLNDATAILVHGGGLLIGGSDGSVHLVDKRDGTLIDSFAVGGAVGAMALVGNTLYVGSPSNQVFSVDIETGVSNLLGVCGGQVHSMTVDGDHLVLGTPHSVVYRMDVNTGFLQTAFNVPNSASALVMHGGDLLCGGSDGTIHRMVADTGLVLGTLSSSGHDVNAMVIGPDENEPGFPYCFGISCPCGNDDILAGCGNSTGAGALMLGSGTASVTQDDLELHTGQMPANVFAIVYMSAIENELSFGDGKLCTGNGYSIFRFPVRNSGPFGVITEGPGIVDYASQTFGPQGQITPGSSWQFQIWYRNPSGPCGNTFNTSNGYTVSFGG